MLAEYEPVVPIDVDQPDYQPINQPANRMSKYERYSALVKNVNAAKKELKDLRPLRARKAMFDDEWKVVDIPVTRGTGRRYHYATRRPRRYNGRRRYRGRGGYFADLLGAGAGALGKALNPFTSFAGVNTSNWGAPATKWGEDIERGLFKRYMGSGAYGDNSTDVAPNTRIEQEVPQFVSPMQCGEEGCILVVNREYLGDVNSSTGFSINQTIVLNPGIPESFPWLSAIAQNFTQYRFKSLIFTFKSTSGALSTTQALGEIIGACQYDVYAAAFTNKTQMLNEIFSSSKVPSMDAIFPIECDPKQTMNTGLMYVRGGAVPSGQDKRFYDMGTFYLASNGMNVANITMGELWVSYVVELIKPQLASTDIAPQVGACAHYWTQGATAGTPTHNLTSVFDNIGLTWGDNGVILPADFQGDLLFNFIWSGPTGATAVAPQISYGYTGATGINVFGYEGSEEQYSFVCANGNVVNTMPANLAVRVPNTGIWSGSIQTVVLGTTGVFPTGAAATTTLDVFVNAYPVNSLK